MLLLLLLVLLLVTDEGVGGRVATEAAAVIAGDGVGVIMAADVFVVGCVWATVGVEVVVAVVASVAVAVASAGVGTGKGAGAVLAAVAVTVAVAVEVEVEVKVEFKFEFEFEFEEVLTLADGVDCVLVVTGSVGDLFGGGSVVVGALDVACCGVAAFTGAGGALVVLATVGGGLMNWSRFHEVGSREVC